MSEPLTFDRVQYWVSNYGHPGVEDKVCVENFVICETREMLPALQAQLYTISQGRFEEGILEQIVGTNRRIKHGSYESWAKLMLLWLSEATKRNP